MLKFVKHVYEGVIGVELYPIITLLTFFIFLVGVSIYVFFIMDKKHIDRMKNIPLVMGLLLLSSPTFAEDVGGNILINEDFMWNFKVLIACLSMVAVLLSVIALMLVIKDPSKISWEGLIANFTGSDAKDPMMDHKYDGIEELDNPIPAWLAAIFWGTVAFAPVYLLIFHVFEWAPLQEEEYTREMALAEMTYKDVELPDDAIVVLNDELSIGKGQEIWMANCIACHGALGEGGIGPNMTDDYWVHGNTIKDLYRTVTNGVPEKGMISWSDQLSSKQRLEVSSFITTLQGTNPPNQKDPEGTLMTGEEVMDIDVSNDSTVTSDTDSIAGNGEIE